KRYHPAAFCAALLNAQPMGFYSPQSLVDDARRHGVLVRRPNINVSNAKAILEPPLAEEPSPGSRVGHAEGVVGGAAGSEPHEWGRGGPGGRLGLSSVSTLGDGGAVGIAVAREHGGASLGIGVRA